MKDVIERLESDLDFTDGRTVIVNRDDLKTLLSYTKQCEEALRLVAEGYFLECRDDRFVIMENPDFRPDNGSDPCIVFDIGSDDEEAFSLIQQGE